MKKIAIFIAVFILMGGGFTSAQEKIDAPIWNAGDKWAYKTADGKKFTNEVVKVDDEFFVVRMGGSPYLNVYDKKTMNITKWIDSSGTEAPASALNIYDFPLFVGKNWGGQILPSGATRVGGQASRWEYSFKVEDREEINTIAGSFKAYRLYCKHSNLGPRAIPGGWIKFWYSPEAKAWVKRVAEKSRYFQGTQFENDIELVSYQLKK